MTVSSVAQPQSRRINIIGIWVLRVLVTLVFGAAGMAKLGGAAMLVTNSTKSAWVSGFAMSPA